MGALAELEVAQVALARGDRVVQEGIDFRIAAGALLSIGGRNGAGKSSLLRAVAGFLEPRSGRIRLRLSDGRVLAAGEERFPFVGWIGDRDGVKSQFTPAENLEFFLRYWGLEAQINGPLALTGLEAARDVPVRYLSAGQRRRLAFARLIAGGRPLWLLDEPLIALDGEGREFAREAIGSHCAGGGMVLAATHEPLGLGGSILELS